MPEEVSISINQFDVRFLSYMQENSELRFQDVATLFPEKSLISLKRSQSNINYYLPQEKHLFCENDTFYCHISYQDFLDFVRRITLRNYHSSVNERLTLIIFSCFIYKVVNTTKLYEETGVGLTTKKKDIKALTDFLTPYQLQVNIINRKGISITGNEVAFRILVMQIISSICEINDPCGCIPRAANNAYERFMYQQLNHNVLMQPENYPELFMCLCKEGDAVLSYQGKKRLYIYLLIAEKRIADGEKIHYFPDSDIYISEKEIMPDPIENKFINQFITSLDHHDAMLSVVDVTLHQHVINFLTEIQGKIITKIAHHEALIDELCLYFQKSVIQRRYHYSIYDNNIFKTENQYPYLFNTVADAVKYIENYYSVLFDKNQIATVCLIIKKFIINSKLTGRNKKKVAIVTNSATEKVDFFIANLNAYMDIGECFVVNIHEIHRLGEFEHHLTIVFSNRISMLLKSQNIAHLKLNYHLQHNDIDKLLACGLSGNINRKIDAQVFVAEIAAIPVQEWADFLRHQYARHFI